MDQHELLACYYEWLVGKIFRYTNEKNDYSRLLEMLHETEYVYSLANDLNRYKDGLELKKTFCWEIGIDKQYYELLGTQCSVLEMMVALAIRCEVSIMSDPAEGDRTWLWFHSMLMSMHLENQTNYNFDVFYSEQCLKRMLFRTYDYYGDGALFKVNDPIYDMREAEVWTQMNWFLSERY